jgi:hypothetical protein
MNKTMEDPTLKEVENMEEVIETYATIMATHKPNPRGPGYIKLYILSAVVFLCSTMNGELPKPDGYIEFWLPNTI